MLQGEHSAILLTFIKLLFVIKIFVLSIFEWLFFTCFTVLVSVILEKSQEFQFLFRIAYDKSMFDIYTLL